jgi:MFS superfamily sulfate permease-like transporter
MARRIRQIVVYAKVTIVILLLLLLIILGLKNWGYKTHFWPGAVDREMPTLWLMVVTGVFSILVYWVFSKTRRVFADLAELRAQQASRRLLEDQERRTQDLDAQERRIDQKINRALEDDAPEE